MATAAKTTDPVLDALREPFPVEAVMQRAGSGGKQLDYVPIETVLQRLLEVAPDYSWDGRVVSTTERLVETRNGPSLQTVAVVEGTLAIAGKIAFGVGAMQNADTDMAVKSANSEAIKNAAKNGFGVALELWNADYRAELDKRRKRGSATAATLKQEVFKLAKERLGKERPSAKDIAGLFGVEPADLADEDSLRTILEKEGLI